MNDQPPTPDAGAGQDDADARPTIVVDDPEDYAKTRQLRSIFDARDDYIKARRKANQAYEEGELDFPERNKRVFRHMQELAMTMGPLLKSYDYGREIWTEHEYGVEDDFVDASDLASFDEAMQEAKSGAADLSIQELNQLIERIKELREGPYQLHSGRGSRERQRLRIAATDWGWTTTGVRSLLSGTPRLAFVLKNNENSFGETAPPQSVSDQVFQDLQDFIREIGLGVQFSEEQTTKIDDDLVDEVDTWRQKNL
jgi:hypothetical protein